MSAYLSGRAPSSRRGGLWKLEGQTAGRVQLLGHGKGDRGLPIQGLSSGSWQGRAYDFLVGFTLVAEPGLSL